MNEFKIKKISPEEKIGKKLSDNRISKGFKTDYDLAVLFNVSIDAVHWKLVNLGIIYNGR